LELFRTVIKTKKYSFWMEHKGAKHEVVWENTNKLLRRPHFIGGKTGVTVTAGPCLASCYELGDKILIVVLLKTSKLSRRFKDTRFLIGLALRRLDKTAHKERIKQVLQNDA
jgi:D-alanyl-D-alanine carboxypeptidase